MTTNSTHRPRRVTLRRGTVVALLTAGTTGLLGAVPAASAAPLGSYRCQGGLSDGRWLAHSQDDFDACRAGGGDIVWVADPDSGPVRPPVFVEG